MRKMRYIVGMDEAGYGPNLGPFVMSLVAMRVPDTCDPWQSLSKVICRADEKSATRIIVDDSKKIHQAGTGPELIESHVAPFLQAYLSDTAHVSEVWQRIIIQNSYEKDPYVTLDGTWPVCSECNQFEALRNELLSQEIHLDYIRSVIIFPMEFNQLVDKHDSKAAAPLTAIERLLHDFLSSPSRNETLPIHIAVDRLGGRSRYAAYLQSIFPEQFIWTMEETASFSLYRIGENITCSFEVQGDQRHFPIALASMLSKYWRELLMSQFNAYFQKLLPNLKPTAGYPVDAKRFWNDIKPLRQQLNLEESKWWRKR